MTRTSRFRFLALAALATGCQSTKIELTAPTDAPVRTAAIVRTSESVGASRPITAATTVVGSTTVISPASSVVATTEFVAATTSPDGRLALDVLTTITVALEHHAGYERDRFGYPADLDGDGCDTRAEVLIRDSLTPAQVDPSGCAVIAGDWYSPYDAVTWSDPAEVQIDHVVALSEAWDSGAWAWDAGRLIAYANDIDDHRALRAVTGSVNGDKGNKDPSNWIPSNDADVCPFLGDWIAIKARWGLTMDPSEFGRIRNLLTKLCPEQRIEPWSSIPIVTVPASVPGTSVATGDTGGGDRSCDPSYPTVCIPASPPDLDCADVPYRRFEVLPPDPHRFDGDHNGIGCEG